MNHGNEINEGQMIVIDAAAKTMRRLVALLRQRAQDLADIHGEPIVVRDHDGVDVIWPRELGGG